MGWVDGAYISYSFSTKRKIIALPKFLEAKDTFFHDVSLKNKRGEPLSEQVRLFSFQIIDDKTLSVLLLNEQWRYDFYLILNLHNFDSFVV